MRKETHPLVEAVKAYKNVIYREQDLEQAERNLNRCLLKLTKKEFNEYVRLTKEDE